MSHSRLEKFIYAICSMDVSDLPVPLSRIEKLWNCLITGETPDFEPLSRNEKYLMAMLDRYDISNLPAPMSRGEKLLYKIAVGETDLSDVPGYLSRYEELLKYLIENGGIGFEYVLYTLNQSLSTLYTTAEKPVKSAILKGQTLVNITSNKKLVGSSYIRVEVDNNLIKPNEQYTLIVNGYSNVSRINCVDNNGLNDYFNIANPKQRNIFTTPNNLTKHHIRVYGKSVDNALLNSIDVILIEGDYTNVDIPYFEGMQSVKMPVLTTTGKNLFDGKIKRGVPNSDSGWQEHIQSENFIRVNSIDFILSINLEYITNSEFVRIYCYDENKNFISTKAITEEKPLNTKYIKFSAQTKNNPSDLSLPYNVQIEYGTVPTTYEPHKSNILTTNEDIELRGIGEVRDELNCLTGELTQRVGEIVLDGTQRWVPSLYTNGDFVKTFVSLDQKLSSPIALCDKMISANIKYDINYNPTEECIWLYNNPNGTNYLYINILSSKLSSVSVRGLNEYFSNNNVKVCVTLYEPFIKTIDLTTVDQDNQPTKLGTFENITHVLLESAGLIPTLEMEVATRISKELASASPLMDDISTKQEQLNTTVDEQSNNVDATMIATTEIYEETL